MKKTLFGILLSLAMMLGLLPGMSLTAYAFDITIYVGGQALSNSGAFVSGGEGKATLTYDGKGNPVLTLENYTYSGVGHEGAAIRYDGMSPLTIELEGNNSVTHEAGSEDTSAGICSANNADLTITGDGSLTVVGGNINGKGRSYGIVTAKGNITISGGTVTATSGSAQTSYAIYANEKAVTISGGRVTAKSGSAQYCAGIVGTGGVFISNAEVEAWARWTTAKPSWTKRQATVRIRL